MTTGYSGTPLAKKLGIKDGTKVLILNQPDYYFDLFEHIPDVTEAEPNDVNIDFIHFFTKDAEELKVMFPKIKGQIHDKGMIWISWPKKASKVPTTIDDAVVRQIGLATGLVDVKVCAVDKVWSGLKFTYRVKDRK